MESGEIRDGITRIFETAREFPRTAYEPERLLAFLTVPAVPSGRMVADTFAGRRRLVRFIEGLQLEFGICFTNEEWEQGRGLADLTGIVTDKLARPAQQLRFAQTRVVQARGRMVSDPIKWGLLAGLLLALPAAMGGAIVRMLLAFVWLVIVTAVVVYCVRDHRYARRLVARIEERR